MINSRMTSKKPPTHRAYCVLRQGRRQPGRWIEAGFAAPADDGVGLKVFLEMLPVSGFDGHILLRPVESKPDAPFPPDPEEEDEDGEIPQSADDDILRKTRKAC
jgi:hypothetical protein